MVERNHEILTTISPDTKYVSVRSAYYNNPENECFVYIKSKICLFFIQGFLRSSACDRQIQKEGDLFLGPFLRGT